MFDTLIEFNITDPGKIQDFDRDTQELHQASYQQTYGVITAGYNEQQTEYFGSRQDFLDFLRDEAAAGRDTKVDVQYQADMPLELECIACPQDLVAPPAG